MADLSPVVGSEQGGVRPVLIIQNNVGNKYSPTVIVSAITSQLGKAKLPTHIDLSAEKYHLPKNSVALLDLNWGRKNERSEQSNFDFSWFCRKNIKQVKKDLFFLCFIS